MGEGGVLLLIARDCLAREVLLLLLRVKCNFKRREIFPVVFLYRSLHVQDMKGEGVICRGDLAVAFFSRCDNPAHVNVHTFIFCNGIGL